MSITHLDKLNAATDWVPKDLRGLFLPSQQIRGLDMNDLRGKEVHVKVQRVGQSSEALCITSVSSIPLTFRGTLLDYVGLDGGFIKARIVTASLTNADRTVTRYTYSDYYAAETLPEFFPVKLTRESAKRAFAHIGLDNGWTLFSEVKDFVMPEEIYSAAMHDKVIKGCVYLKDAEEAHSYLKLNKVKNTPYSFMCSFPLAGEIPAPLKRTDLESVHSLPILSKDKITFGVECPPKTANTLLFAIYEAGGKVWKHRVWDW